MIPIADSERDWVVTQLSAYTGLSMHIVETTPMPSRGGPVIRLTVAAHGVTQTFFLKYLSESSERDLAVLFTQLGAIADAVASHPDLAPYRVVAYEPTACLWLTADVPGEPLGAMHAAAAWDRHARARSLAGWRGLGTWLATLHWHTLDPIRSETYVSDLVAYAARRFLKWMEHDHRRERLALRAVDVVRRAGRLLATEAVTLVPCHGDVSSFNVLVGEQVGLIDFDDFDYAMPAIDVSQAMFEIEQFSRVGHVVKIPGYQKAATAALFEGYTGPLPRGEAFWLPHFRNLAVYLLTIARRTSGARGEFSLERYRYARLIHHLETAIDAATTNRDWLSIYGVPERTPALLGS